MLLIHIQSSADARRCQQAAAVAMTAGVQSIGKIQPTGCQSNKSQTRHWPSSMWSRMEGWCPLPLRRDNFTMARKRVKICQGILFSGIFWQKNATKIWTVLSWPTGFELFTMTRKSQNVPNHWADRDQYSLLITIMSPPRKMYQDYSNTRMTKSRFSKMCSDYFIWHHSKAIWNYIVNVD